MPLEYWRWEIAREFGWTLEYVDGLSAANLFEYWQIVDGRNKAHNEARQAQTQRRKR